MLQKLNQEQKDQILAFKNHESLNFLSWLNECKDKVLLIKFSITWLNQIDGVNFLCRQNCIAEKKKEKKGFFMFLWCDVW